MQELVLLVFPLLELFENDLVPLALLVEHFAFCYFLVSHFLLVQSRQLAQGDLHGVIDTLVRMIVSLMEPPPDHRFYFGLLLEGYVLRHASRSFTGVFALQIAGSSAS